MNKNFLDTNGTIWIYCFCKHAEIDKNVLICLDVKKNKKKPWNKQKLRAGGSAQMRDVKARTVSGPCFALLFAYSRHRRLVSSMHAAVASRRRHSTLRRP